MLIYILEILIAVGVLWKCADWFVEGAVGIAEKLGVPKLLVGLVLVSVATSLPELMTSLLAAFQGMPQLALGNGVGSIAIDESVALGLGAAVTAAPLTACLKTLRMSAFVLIGVIVIAFVLSLNGTLGQLEGGFLVLIFLAYNIQLYRSHRAQNNAAKEVAKTLESVPGKEDPGQMKVLTILLFFIGGLLGVLIGSQILLTGALGIAKAFGLPPVIIGLTITAIGTSTPEIATCIVSALKRESAIGVGNIIGSDIFNICCVAGLSAVVHPLTVSNSLVIYFMFPGVLVIVLTVLAMLRFLGGLNRWCGLTLLGLYLIYISILFYLVHKGAPLPA